MSMIYLTGLVRNAFGFVGFLKISLNIFSDNRKQRSHSSNMSILVEDALINAEKCRELKVSSNWESNNAMRNFEFSLGRFNLLFFKDLKHKSSAAVAA